MITKYKLFENNDVRYISDGEYNCPVCGSDDYEQQHEYEYRDCICNDCDFEWVKNTEDVFDQSFDEDNRTLNGGKNRCPYCNSDDYDIMETEIEDFELIEHVLCNNCYKKWDREYNNIVVSVVDNKFKQIKKGDIVDTSLFNVSKYKKIKANKFNL